MMTELEAEKEPTDELKNMPTQWPSKGEITFDGVVMPYLPGHPPLLKGIGFSIREGEKVGVVGCTSAGKSSFIYCWCLCSKPMAMPHRFPLQELGCAV